MTQAYYFSKQNVDFEKLSDDTKDVLFNEFKKEKYSNIFKPFLNKIKNEFLHAFKNIPDIEIDIPNDNFYVLIYENNKFNFSIAKACYSKVKSSFFYNELLAQLSSQSPFKFFSQKDLETGLSDRLYEKAKQYLELSSNLNEKTLPDLEQSFNKIKGFSTNQSQPKEAKKTKTAGFHL